jgi:hypothetical protein
MHRRLIAHVKHNAVGYVALFAALGGTSYAAVRLTPGSVTNRAIAPGAVSHAKLATNSVNAANIMNGTLTKADLAAGTLASLTNGSNGAAGGKGGRGATGPAGPAGPAGRAGSDGSAAIVARARGTASVSAPHGATTSVPVDGGTWTQDTGDVDLVTGSVTIKTPSACTGSFGNSLMLQVDGAPATFAVAPTAPPSGTVSMPIAVMAVMEPASSTSHTLTASLANSCTKAGEDYGVSDLKVDVVKFH